MKLPYHSVIVLSGLILIALCPAFSQPSTAQAIANYQQVNTYVNPVLPGDHPDPTLLKVGDDFYHCGSSFHFNPYLPIYHSKDLVHWQVIARVVPSSKAVGWVSDKPSGGIWQGAITYFYGSYWIYFSSGGQWFCKANAPFGPWTDAVKVKENAITGPLGYDNSIFVDDDGKPYMVIKNGQKINRLQALGHDGQLTDTVINLDWINAHLQYSWAEGPVMGKRNGYYYYYPAGDVSGGQYVLRTKKLTSDSTQWERLGEFFKPVTDLDAGFRRPNHIAAPVQLSDGTWWTLGQSYEKYGSDDWHGTGRQTSLYPVIWEGDRPWGMAPTSQPIIKPDLPQAGILWRSVQGDEFDKAQLGLQWHFMNRKAAASYSLTNRKGWLRLLPDSNRVHLLQKETDHYYTVLTKVDLNTIDKTSKAGIYLTNGNQAVTVTLCSGFDNGKKIIFTLDSNSQSIKNEFGNTVWLKLERKRHLLTAWCSSNGKKWIPVGKAISAAILDKVQPNYNSWVGTSIGLFAEGEMADFDFFTCKDAFSELHAAGYNNYFGIKTIHQDDADIVTNSSSNGGWLMIAGVETGSYTAGSVQITAASAGKGAFEIWLDDLKEGKLIATIPIGSTGGKNNWKTFSKSIKSFKGHHDVFIKFPVGSNNQVFIKNIRFLKNANTI
ncbi:MAG: family 43 glycosylhydrolase [Chitinophagaceae bacterium]